MAVTITLDDTLVAQLQAQAAVRNLSVEALALHTLSEHAGARPQGDSAGGEAWQPQDQGPQYYPGLLTHGL